MGWIAIARKDFLDAIRSNALAGLTLLFVLFAGGLAAIRWIPVIYRGSEVERSTLVLLNSMRQPNVFLVPMIGLLAGYKSIVGEREGGSLKLALGLPNTRRDVVFGKYLGRTAVVGVSILVGYTAAAIVTILFYDSFAIVIYGIYTLLTVLYGSVYIAIATGLSAATRSEGYALGISVGLYALFLLFWDVLLLGLQLVIYGSSIPEAGLPAWFQFIGVLNPSTAFVFATRAVIPAYYELTIYPESSAVYLQDWIGFVVLALWIVVPLGLGYYRFARSDLT